MSVDNKITNVNDGTEQLSEPRELKRAWIKEEMVALTGNLIDAVILNHLIGCQARSRQIERFIEEERERLRNIGAELATAPTHGWFYKKSDELSEETMVGLSKSNIRARLKKMIRSGWLMERDNPYIKWDKTKQYRVDLKRIFLDLEAIGYTLDGWLISRISESEPRSAGSEPRSSKTKPRESETKPRRGANETAIPSTYITGTSIQEINKQESNHQSRTKEVLIDDDDASLNASLNPSSTTTEAKPDSVDDSKVLLEWLTTAGKIPRELAARLIGSSPIPQMGAQELVSALRELGGRGSGPTSPRALVAADAAAVRRQLLVWPHCNEADSDKVRNKYGILVSKIQSDDSPPPELRETLPKSFSSNSSEVDNKRLKAEQRECSAYWKSLSEHQRREFDADFKTELQERYPGQYISPSAPEYGALRRAHLQDAKTREWLASIAPESGEFVESEELGPDRVPEPDTAVVAEAAEAAEPEEIDRLQITADELLQEIGHGNASVESLESDIAEFYPQFDDDERAEIAALVRERLGESPEE